MKQPEIIELLLTHDERGMEALLLHYGPLMRYVIAPILPDAHDQADCVSEVTVRVWEKIDQFDAGRGSWNAWLTAVSRNTALNYARKNARHSGLDEIPPDTPSPEPTPEEVVLQKERQAALRSALEKLSPKDRTLFYRKYYYLQSTAQIASELGLTERAKAMNDHDFDAMLTESISELPPDDIAEDVTPWRRAMNRILFGLRCA